MSDEFEKKERIKKEERNEGPERKDISSDE